jgi:AraC family transcriptional regulator of adaptative response/methylated-DNA-[protein]-cysteine methyltransferase
MQQRAIAYRVVECPLGVLLVAGTPRGVCKVRFGDDPACLVAELESEFPFAAIEPDAGRLDAWVDALLRYLRGDERELAVPLDVRGSQFQRRVWSAIRAIPYGAMRSYAEIAAAIDRPQAARAVAGACAANPVPLLVPCHRVVGSGGRLGGYRYGVARKSALLAAERGSDWGGDASWSSMPQPASGSAFVKCSKTRPGSASDSKTTSAPGPSAAIQRVGCAPG